MSEHHRIMGTVVREDETIAKPRNESVDALHWPILDEHVVNEPKRPQPPSDRGTRADWKNQLDRTVRRPDFFIIFAIRENPPALFRKPRKICDGNVVVPFLFVAFRHD
jgi:hypothetical protein